MNQSDLDKILKKKNYGIQSSIGKGSIHSQVSDTGEMSDTKSGIGYEPVRAAKPAFNYTGRCVVRVKVFRKRLCDPDNNICKWHIDACRYALILRGDDAKEMDYHFEGQEKVQTDQEERVEVTLEYQDAWMEH